MYREFLINAEFPRRDMPRRRATRPAVPCVIIFFSYRHVSKGEPMFNRVAFVTGASRGIGRAIALTLCRSGFDIVVASPEIEKNEEVAEEIRACSGEAMTLNLDVTSHDSVKEAFGKAMQDKGRIDVLVNNAGITRD